MPGERAAGRPVGGGERGRHPQPDGAREPDLAAALYEPFPYDYRGEQAEGGRPYYVLPVFTEWAGRLFVRAIPPYIWASQRHPDAPRLSDTAKAALLRLVELADDPDHHVLMELQPGDVQLIDNFHVLHGRTAYEDDRGPRRDPAPQAALAGDIRPHRPAAPLRRSTSSHWLERRARAASRSADERLDAERDRFGVPAPGEDLLGDEHDEEQQHRRAGDRRVAGRAGVEAQQQPDDDAERAEQTDMAIIAGTRRTRSDAVGGGPISSPNTSSVPMAWKLATMLTARRTSSAAWARAGWQPEGRAPWPG